MNSIKHNFSHTQIDFPDLIIFATDIMIDDEPIVVTASTHSHVYPMSIHYERSEMMRYVSDNYGNLYELKYCKKYVCGIVCLMPSGEAYLIHDSSKSDIQIKKFVCHKRGLYILDVLHNLYKLNKDRNSINLELIHENIVNVWRMTFDYLAFDINNKIYSDDKSLIEMFDLDFSIFFELHECWRNIIILDINGKLTIDRCVISENVKYLSTIYLSTNAIYDYDDTAWIIYSSETDTLRYMNVKNNFVSENIRTDSEILSVFAHRSAHDKIIFYYITLSGVYEINQNTNQSVRITKNISNYMPQTEYVHIFNNTKSARKI